MNGRFWFIAALALKMALPRVAEGALYDAFVPWSSGAEANIDETPAGLTHQRKPYFFGREDEFQAYYLSFLRVESAGANPNPLSVASDRTMTCGFQATSDAKLWLHAYLKGVLSREDQGQAEVISDVTVIDLNDPTNPVLQINAGNDGGLWKVTQAANGTKPFDATSLHNGVDLRANRRYQIIARLQGNAGTIPANKKADAWVDMVRPGEDFYFNVSFAITPREAPKNWRGPDGINDTKARKKDEFVRGIELTGKAIRVGVLELGRPIANHKHLKGRMNIIRGAEFPDAGEPKFRDEHPTACAGVIAADPGGVAPKAELYAVSTEATRKTQKELTDENERPRFAPVFEDARTALKANSIRVVSISAGYSASIADRAEIAGIINKLVAQDNITVVASAGNDGKGAAGGVGRAPGEAAGSIAVGALDRTFGQVAEFSNDQPGPNGSPPHLTAPGEYIETTVVVPMAANKRRKNGNPPESQDYIFYGYFRGDSNRGLKTSGDISGTSFSAPMVAGTVALYLELLADAKFAAVRDKESLPDAIRATLMTAARKTVPGAVAPGNELKYKDGAKYNPAKDVIINPREGAKLYKQIGAGLLDVYETLKQVNDRAPVAPAAPAPAPAPRPGVTKGGLSPGNSLASPDPGSALLARMDLTGPRAIEVFPISPYQQQEYALPGALQLGDTLTVSLSWQLHGAEFDPGQDLDLAVALYKDNDPQDGVGNNLLISGYAFDADGVLLPPMLGPDQLKRVADGGWPGAEHLSHSITSASDAGPYYFRVLNLSGQSGQFAFAAKVDYAPRLSLQGRCADGTLQLHWPAAATDYSLEYTELLNPMAQWIPLGGAVLGTNGQFTQFISCDGVRRYFRLRNTAPPRVALAGLAGYGGQISPAGWFETNAGANIQFAAAPDPYYAVDQWFLNNELVQTNGDSLSLSNVQSSQSVRVSFKVADGALDLAVNQYASDNPALVGSNVTYAILVQNLGPATASGVTLTNLLPAGVVFVSALSSTGNCSYANGGLSCDLGSIAPGDSVEIDVTVNTLSEGSLTNWVSVTNDIPDPNPANNQSTSVISVREPLLVTASAGTNGGLAPAGAFVVARGTDQSFTAYPDTNYVVQYWLVNGAVAQVGGDDFLSADVEINLAVQVVFKPLNKLPNDFPGAVDKGAWIDQQGKAHPWKVGLATVNGKPVWDDELAALAAPLARKGVAFHFAFAQCFGGGMLQNLAAIGNPNQGRAIRISGASAVKWNQAAWLREPPYVLVQPLPNPNNHNLDWPDPYIANVGGANSAVFTAVQAWLGDPYRPATVGRPNARGPDEDTPFNETAQFREKPGGGGGLFVHSAANGVKRRVILYSGKPGGNRPDNPGVTGLVEARPANPNIDAEQIVALWNLLTDPLGYNYQPNDIQVLFGNGGQPAGAPANMMGRVEAATAVNLQAAFNNLANLANNDQVFFFANDHGTARNDAMPPNCWLNVPRSPNKIPNTNQNIWLPQFPASPASPQGLERYVPDPNDPFLGWNNDPYFVCLPLIVQLPQGTNVNAGAMVSFVVSATGTSPLSYQWRLQGTNLFGATNATLMLSNVTGGQAGVYEIEVTNAYGSVTGAPVYLIVNDNRDGLPFNTTLARPSVAVLLLGGGNTAGLPLNTSLAQPPVTVFLLGSGNTAGLAANTTLAQPPVKAQFATTPAAAAAPPAGPPSQETASKQIP